MMDTSHTATPITLYPAYTSASYTASADAVFAFFERGLRDTNSALRHRRNQSNELTFLRILDWCELCRSSARVFSRDSGQTMFGLGNVVVARDGILEKGGWVVGGVMGGSIFGRGRVG